MSTENLNARYECPECHAEQMLPRLSGSGEYKCKQCASYMCLIEPKHVTEAELEAYITTRHHEFDEAQKLVGGDEAQDAKRILAARRNELHVLRFWFRGVCRRGKSAGEGREGR